MKFSAKGYIAIIEIFLIEIISRKKDNRDRFSVLDEDRGWKPCNGTLGYVFWGSDGVC